MCSFTNIFTLTILNLSLIQFCFYHFSSSESSFPVVWQEVSRSSTKQSNRLSQGGDDSKKFFYFMINDFKFPFTKGFCFGIIVLR